MTTGLMAAGCAAAAPPAPAGAPPASSTAPPANVRAAPTETGGPVVTQSTAGQAAAALAALPVKGRTPKTGYTREEFGQAWSDDVTVAYGHDGCDTRNNILGRDLTDTTTKPGTRDCVVLRGTLHDPYTGRAIAFQRGPGDANIQIDHVVALSDAWQTGARNLTVDQRRDLANDPLNLLAVDGPTNQAKSDADAATWLPPNKAFRCSYVARQLAVKTKYHLWVTPAERDAITRVLARCPQQKIATRDTVAATAAPALPSLSPSQDGSSSPESGTTDDPTSDPTGGAGGMDPRFPSCTAAKAAGFGPYRRGVDPEAEWYRDGDGDGVVCE